MVCVDGEVPAFHIVFEVFDCQVNGQQLTIICAVAGLWALKLTAKKGQGLPAVGDVLL